MNSKGDVLFLDQFPQFVSIFNRQANWQELDVLSFIRFKLDSLHYCVVGPEWGSFGIKRTSHFHHLHFAVSGSAKVFHEGRTLELSAGGVYWLPANCPLECSCEKSYEQYFLTLQIEWANGIELFLKGHKPVRMGSWDPRDVSREWKKRPLPLNAYWRLQAVVQKLFAETLTDIEVVMKEQYAFQTHFSNVFKFIDEHLSTHISVLDLARVQGVSPKAFSRGFADCFGLSPRKYLNNRLNVKALELVVGSDVGMARIADMLGFNDEYYFNRFFSKMNGVSPFKYRKKFIS
jgi:AraC-like DNA-binding protein